MLHTIRQSYNGERRLDGKTVARINAYLLPFGPDSNPATLQQEHSALLGSKPGSSGFIISNEGKAGFSEAEVEALLKLEPNAAEIIFPYLSGEDILSGPRPGPARKIIDFGEDNLDLLQRKYPATLSRLRAAIAPSPDSRTWQTFARMAKELRTHFKNAGKISFLCIPETSKWHVVERQKGRMVPSNSVVVFTTDVMSYFCCLQSGIHELWCREFSSTLEDRLRYVASDCFETFPFPLSWQNNLATEQCGRRYYEFRAAVMTSRNEGLTNVYNHLGAAPFGRRAA